MALIDQAISTKPLSGQLLPRPYVTMTPPITIRVRTISNACILDVATWLSFNLGLGLGNLYHPLHFVESLSVQSFAAWPKLSFVSVLRGTVQCTVVYCTWCLFDTCVRVCVRACMYTHVWSVWYDIHGVYLYTGWLICCFVIIVWFHLMWFDWLLTCLLYHDVVLRRLSSGPLTFALTYCIVCSTRQAWAATGTSPTRTWPPPDPVLYYPRYYTRNYTRYYTRYYTILYYT